MLNWPEKMLFFSQCQIDFLVCIPNIYIPATFFLFIQLGVLKRRLNFTRLNIIQTQNDASISRASCALSFIYEAFFPLFLPSLSLFSSNSQYGNGVWQLVCTHTCMRAYLYTVPLSAELPGWTGAGSVSSTWLRWLQWGRAETTFPP